MPITVVRTIKPSGGDFTSLSAWWAYVQGLGSLVARDVVERVECYKGDYSASGGGINYILEGASIDISGVETDFTRRVEIVVPQSEYHGGVLKDASGVYRGFTIRFGSNWKRLHLALRVQTVTGVAIDKEGRAGDAFSLSAATPPSIGAYPYSLVLDRCLGANAKSRNFNFGSGQEGRTTYGFIAINCISIGGGTGFLFANYKKGRIYNSTAVNGSSTGFAWGSRTPNVLGRNLLASGNGADFSAIPAGADVDFCASSDGTAPGANSRINQTFAFVDAANGDYHLASTDTGARGYGTDLSADPAYPFNWDIDGETRTAPWDIGADQYVAPASGYTADILASLPALLSSLSSSVVRQADVSAVLSQLVSSSSSILRHNADISTSLPALQSTTSASRVLKASVQAVLQALTASLTADVIAPGTKTVDISARLPDLQAALAATRGLQADLSAVLPALRASASTTLEHIASVSVSLANLQATLSAGKVQTADIATSLPSLVASLTASQAIAARISAQLPQLQGSSSAELVITAFIAASLSALQASLGGSVTRVASVQTTLPSLSARIISGRLKRSFEVYRSVSQIKLAVRLESKLDQRSFRATSRLGVQSE